MNESPKPALACHDLHVSVPGRELVQNLNLDLVMGEIVAVLGPNGVGKSLTLLTLAGLRSPASGAVTLGGVSIEMLTRQEIARSLALLPQSSDDVFPATVLDTVLIGRHPHIRRFQWESPDDLRYAQDALHDVGLDELQNRDVATLSGGERRRLAIAQVITQAPSTFLLDEPTNHLDPQHQLEVLALFRRFADSGAAVLTSLHDVNLAARFADRCLLLDGLGNWHIGASDEVLTDERLSELYATRIESVTWRERRLFVAAG